MDWRGKREAKKVFGRLAPVHKEGLFRNKTEEGPDGKNRKSIKEAITTLQASLEQDDMSFVELQSVIEQACNYFLQHERFPLTYEELQPVPLLSVGVLTYAGDDGGAKGQAYRLAIELVEGE